MIFFPVFNPKKDLIITIKKLLSRGINSKFICVIDDGSKIGFNIFNEINKKNILILRHKFNQGKGKGIKTALEFAKRNKIKFSIFADADGQHDVRDIILLFKIASSNKFDYKKVIITQRNFKKKIPFASKLGNFISSFLVHLIYGQKFKDTQCGLRLIPYKLYKDFLKFHNNGFDYEMKCFLYSVKQNILNSNIYIKSIYKKNRYSNFRKIRDSYMITKQIFKFYDN